MHDNFSAEPPILVLVHPSRLFSDALANLLTSTPYKLTLRAPCLEHVPPDAFEGQSKRVFLVGGCATAGLVETIRNIRRQLSLVYIVVLGISSDPREVMLAIEAGADGYLREAMTAQTLIKAIELILEDETILPPEFVKSMHGRASEQKPEFLNADSASNGSKIEEQSSPQESGQLLLAMRLTVREASILRALSNGAPNKVIAQTLDITEATVKIHVKSILRKIRVKNRTQAAIWAAKNHLFAEADSGTPIKLEPSDLNGSVMQPFA